LNPVLSIKKTKQMINLRLHATRQKIFTFLCCLFLMQMSFAATIEGAASLCPDSETTFTLVDGNATNTWEVRGAGRIVSSSLSNTTTITVRSSNVCLDSFSITVRSGSQTLVKKVIVADRTAPIFSSALPALSLSCGTNLEPLKPIAADNCGKPVVVTLKQINPGTVANCSAVIVWEATDACGNKATATQALSYTTPDNTPPVFAPLPALNYACHLVPSTFPKPVVSDNCTNPVNVTLQSRTGHGINNCFTYCITLTWLAVDACGNRTTATQLVNVTDTQAPEFGPMPAIPPTLSCNRRAGEWDDCKPPVSDNCSQPVMLRLVSESNVVGDACFRIVDLTWEAMDRCGNTSRATQTIYLLDDVAPVFGDLPPLFVSCENAPGTEASFNQVRNFYSTYTPTNVTDNCQEVTVELADYETTGSYCNRRVRLTWIAYDGCGNNSTKTQQVLIIDDGKPAIRERFPTRRVKCATDIPPPSTITVTDNCDPNPTYSVRGERRNVECPNKFTFVRTYTAIDNCFNTSTVEEIIEVNDDVAPVLSGVPANVTIECSDLASLPRPRVTATDNCAPMPTVSLVPTRVDGRCDQSYLIYNLWTATDACGNTATGLQVVCVTDFTAPRLVGVPANVTVECNNLPAAPTVSATDNCDPNPTVSCSMMRREGACAYSYFIDNLWTATDDCGNTSTASQTITVLDRTPPRLVGVPANITVECNNLPAPVLVTATDNCDPNPSVVPSSSRMNSTQCPQNYKITNTWIATDACGNSASATQTITVLDRTPPMLENVPADESVECSAPQINGNGSRGLVLVTARDNCDPNPRVTSSTVEIPGTCPGNYKIETTWTATDACGNTATKKQTITVTDTKGPEFDVPGDLTLDCNTDIDMLAFYPFTPIDDCSGISVVSRSAIAAGGCPKIVTHAYTASDNCGNTTTKTFTVTFVDNEAPELEDCFSKLPGSFTGLQTLYVDCANISEPLPKPCFIDNCTPMTDIRVVQTSIVPTLAFLCDDISPNSSCATILWTATDLCGNTATATQQVCINFNNIPRRVAKISDILNGTGTQESLKSDENEVKLTEPIAAKPALQAKIATDMQLSVFPNPTRGKVYFRVTVPESGDGELMLYNTTGQVIGKINQLGMQAGNEYILSYDLQETAASGIILYNFRLGSHSKSGRIMHNSK
jgi:large repetitive protein